MKILILGGTGAMGAHLVDILSQNDDNEIFVTTRRNRTAKKENITYVVGDAHGNGFISSLLKQEEWDAIVDFMVYNTEEFKFRADLFLSSCKQYVFLSSSRVYADSKEPITEKSPRLLDVCNDKEYLSTDEYALTKARQENILFESGKKNWTIIRPYITFSENRLQLGVLEKEYWLYAVLNCGVLVFSKDIAQHTTTLTYGYDVARGITAIIGNAKAYGEAFHITGNNAIKWQSVFELYSKVLKERGVVFDEFLKEKTYRLNGTGKYQVLFDRYYDRIFDNSKIAQFVDISSFVKPEEGLKSCLIEFLKKPQFLYCDIKGILEYLKNTTGKVPFSKLPTFKQKIKYILIRLHIL